LGIGGGGQDRDLLLLNGAGQQRVYLGAKYSQLMIVNDTEKLVEIGGSAGGIVAKGDIVAKGQVVSKGTLVAEDNLTHQRITERSRKVDQDQHYDLFSVAQHGAFVVELAASYSVRVGDTDETLRGSSYVRWVVFTYDKADVPWQAAPDGG